MASSASQLVAEIALLYPGATVRGRGKKHLDFVLPDGQGVYVARIDDLHVKDASDQWIEVDESLVDDTSVSGFVASCTKAQHTVRFGSGGGRRWYPRRNVPTEYVQTSKPDYWQESQSRWRVWNLTGLTRGTNTATWDTTTYQVKVTNTWRQLKLSYTLKTAAAYPRIRYPWTLVGLNYSNETHQFTSTTDGTVVGTLAEPHAVDANGADVPVTGVYSGGYFEIVLTPGSAVYPIVMDPDDTFTDGYGGDVATAADTYLASWNPNNNFGVNGALRLGPGLVRFDCSSIPSTATCDSAHMYLYRVWSDSINTINAYSVASANSGWSEGTKDDATAGAGESCWNYKNYDSAAWAGSAGAQTSGTDYEDTSIGSWEMRWDDANGYEYNISLSTARIAGWFGVSNTNYGLLLGPARGENVSSSDDATTGYRPKLVVTYTAGGTTAAPRRALLGVGL